MPHGVTLTMFTSSKVSGVSGHPPLALRSHQNPLEPLLFLPTRPSKQIEGEVPTREGGLSFPLPSARPGGSVPWGGGGGGGSGVLAGVRALPLSLGHEVVLLGQLDANGVLLVPQPLPGQMVRNEEDLVEEEGGVHTQQ